MTPRARLYLLCALLAGCAYFQPYSSPYRNVEVLDTGGYLSQGRAQWLYDQTAERVEKYLRENIRGSADKEIIRHPKIMIRVMDKYDVSGRMQTRYCLSKTEASGTCYEIKIKKWDGKRDYMESVLKHEYRHVIYENLSERQRSELFAGRV